MKTFEDGLTLVFTDSHTHKNSLQELEVVFEEILGLAYKYKPRYIVCAGDFYDEKILGPEVLAFGTKWVRKFLEICSEFIMLTGNHVAMKDGVTSVDYLNYLSNAVTVLDECVIGNTLYGHFCTEKSQMCYNGILTGNKYERETEKLKQYDLVILGHQHWKQFIEPNIYHLCSCRYVTFGEVDADGKFVGLVQNNKIEFIPLKSVYPLIDIHSLEEAETIEKPEITKVRFVIDSFQYLKEHLNEIETLKDKFYRFKRKLNFVDKVSTVTKIDQYKKKNLQYQVYEWIQAIKDKEVQEILIEELKDLYSVT